MARADELVEGRVYYLVHFAGEEAMNAPVIISVLYTGTQDDEGQFVFLPLPAGNSEMHLEPEALERVMELEDLKAQLARK